MFSCGNDYGTTPMVISNLDVSRWNPASCTNMSFMFYGCRSQKEIDVSNWDVSKVQNFDHMFAHSYLKVNGTRNWKTTSATNMNALFHSVQNTVLDLTNFDTKNVQFFDQMFQSAGSLIKIIGLERFNTSNGLGFDEMFQSCSNLRELNLSSFDTRKAKDGVTASTNGHKTATMSNFFQNNYRLEKVTFGENFSFKGDGTTTNTAHHAALHAPTTTYIPNADGKWYTQKRVPYTPAEIQTNGAETYYASLDLANDIDFLIKNKTLMDIGDAIRERVVDEVYYSPAQMANVISSMEDIGVNLTFENYSVTDDGNGNITISKGV
jgi:surface protein